MTQKTDPQNAFSHLIETVHRLRAPGGCAWDRAQTHQSLRQYLIEEAYEVLDVIDQIHTESDLQKPSIKGAFREELGDLLMQVLLHSEMASEGGYFDIHDVAQSLGEKLVRRHPHVFKANSKENSADSALQQWEKEKAKEKTKQVGSSILDGVPKSLPALQKTARIIEKVTKVGFQWSDIQGPLAKLDEELKEFKDEVQILDQNKNNPDLLPQIKEKVASELGDLFFSLCNIAYHFQIHPEDTLRKTLFKFEKRFRYVEKRLKEEGKAPENSSLSEMDLLWNEAKALEKIQVWGLTGGIASGKSTVAQIFSEFGIPVIDADQIARELSSETGLAYSDIQKRFGNLKKAELRDLVFSDPQAKADLESILHPYIQKQSSKLIRELSQKHKFIVYEAALLVETNRYKDFDGLIVVTAPKEARLHRLIQRNSLEPSLAEKIISSQSSDERKLQVATHVIENSGSFEELKKKVHEFLEPTDFNKTKTIDK